jgi:hypothetical protein
LNSVIIIIRFKKKFKQRQALDLSEELKQIQIA